MNYPKTNLTILALSLASFLFAAAMPARAVAYQPNSDDEATYFSNEVLPLLKQHCFDCHSHESGESNGQLMLDSLAAMVAGGTRGAAIVPGEAQKSVLLKALLHTDTDLQMPPDERLPESEIAIFERWINKGAIVPEAMQGSSVANDAGRGDGKDHWAYQPLQTSPKSIDEILRVGLAERSLDFSPPATRRTLLRRLSYDLCGLPPTAEEFRAFETDPRNDDEATSALIERLLASPHFGERWARYWMDVARYADNKGYVFQEDREYPGAYQYRDWLIDAFNADLPYDQFVTKQLAADLLAENSSSVDLPALGFLTLGRRFLNNKLDIIDDRLDVVSRGLMGMTLTCARCHDHKYDPISQADYYAMAGVFLNTDEPGGEPWPHRLQDSKENRQAFILLRGRIPGEKVDRRFVSFLAADSEPFGTGSGRAELAAHITSPENPLTARVFVNRVWMRMTGQSLVESPSDLGTRCPPPQQLALLDQLAVNFMSDGWSIKQLIRRIANSDVYQQQSLDRPECSQVDPQNSLYWRMNRRRLDFEAFRDTLLARADLLDPTLHGPSAKIDGNELMRRRAVYAYIDRQNLPSVFRTFDFASPDAHNSARPQTSVPQQGLFVLNSGFISELAIEIGKTASLSAGSGDFDARIQSMFSQVLARAANEEELQLARKFLTQAEQSSAEVGDQRWVCGYGAFDPKLHQLANFTRLPFFGDSRWQGGKELPDPVLGWCMFHADGGHVGNDLEHAVVRRWVAPRDGVVHVRGKLSHPSEAGDGVRGTLLVDGVDQGHWIVKNREQNTNASQLVVKSGQSIDFVTDCIESHNNDSFSWSVRVRYTDGNRESFSSQEEHPTPPPEPLDRWSQLAQILLATNELAFVD